MRAPPLRSRASPRRRPCAARCRARRRSPGCARRWSCARRHRPSRRRCSTAHGGASNLSATARRDQPGRERSCGPPKEKFYSRAMVTMRWSPGRRPMRTLVAVLLSVAAAAAHAQYPQRPVQLIVPWGAGGGTDATARIIASLLERELKQPINVVNRTGGSGVVGHQAIASSPADGYTLGMITVEITMMHWVGLTPLTYKDYTPIGLVNADPAGIHVRVDSPYKSTKDLIAAIKATPGKMKASGTGQGGIWHLAIAGLLKDQGVEPTALPWVPSNGAAPGLQDLVAGGGDVVPCSIPEARAMIDAGQERALAIIDSSPP